MALSCGVAYLASGSSGLRAVDISDPAAPVEMGALITRYSAVSVFVSAELNFVGVSWNPLAGSRLNGCGP